MNHPEHKRDLIFACGNESRGDDALGPLLIERLKKQRELKENRQSFELLSDYQFQVEHVLDLHQRERVIFVDASVSAEPPYAFEKLEIDSADGRIASYTSHALHPAQLLPVYRQYFHESPPPCYLLSIRGESFELGESLSRAAADHLEQATQFLLDFLT